MTRTRILQLILLKLLLAATAIAQIPDAPTPVSTSQPAIPPRPDPFYVAPGEVFFYPYAGIFCGVGATNSTVSTKSTLGCGVAFPFIPTPAPIVTEIGVMGPQANRSSFSAYLSEDLIIPLSHKPLAFFPSAIIGYSRLFETGHALDYGLAINTNRLRKDKNLRDLRIELRDYYTFANPTQHNIVLRIGIITPIMD